MLRMLLLLLLVSGCADLRAQAEPARAPEAKPIDSGRLFDQLQAIRSVEESQDTRLAAIETSIDGLAQRLDHPAPVSFPPPSTINPQPASTVRPACITIRGTDYDLEPLLDKFDKPWTWPGLTESSLREHLEDHDVAGVDDLAMDDLVKLHAVVHDMEAKPAEPGGAPVGINPLLETPTPSKPKTTVQNCPGGQCPAPGTVRSTTRQWTWTVPATRASRKVNRWK